MIPISPKNPGFFGSKINFLIFAWAKPWMRSHRKFRGYSLSQYLKAKIQSLELIIAAAKKFCNLNLVQDIFYSSQVLTESVNIGRHVNDVDGKARIVYMTSLNANLGLR